MSIYEQIGGADSVAAAVDVFYDKVLADPVLSGYFADTSMRRQKMHMRAFLASAIGGAEIYAGRDMHAAHARLRITDEAFDRVVGHLGATLAELDVPDAITDAIAGKLAPLRSAIVAPAVAA